MALLGMAACIGAFFIPAPAGLLADGSISIFQALSPDGVLTRFALPALLAVLTAVLVMIGKPRVLALLTAAAGGALFGWTDAGFAMSNRACYGILFNAVGIVLLIAAALLTAFGTPTAGQIIKQKKTDREKAKRHEEMEAEMFFEDASEEEEFLYPDDAGIDEDDFIDFEALGALSAASDNQMADRHNDEVSQTELDDIAALLRKEINESHAAEEAVPESPEAEPVSIKPAGAAGMTDEEEKSITEFYEGLESMFLEDQ